MAGLSRVACVLSALMSMLGSLSPAPAEAFVQQLQAPTTHLRSRLCSQHLHWRHIPRLRPIVARRRSLCQVSPSLCPPSLAQQLRGTRPTGQRAAMSLVLAQLTIATINLLGVGSPIDSTPPCAPMGLLYSGCAAAARWTTCSQRRPWLSAYWNA